MFLARKIWIAIGVVVVGIFVITLVLGTEIRLERHVEVVGPDEPVYYMIMRNKPLELIEEELQKNPQVVYDSYIINSGLLAHAVVKGREDVVRLLLEMGANPNGGGRPGEYTPLMCAVSYNQKEIAAILLRHGSDPDLKGGGFGSSPRELAEYEGNHDILLLFAKNRENKVSGSPG